MKQVSLKQNRFGWTLTQLILTLVIIAIVLLLLWPQIKGVETGMELQKADHYLTQIQGLLKDSLTEQNPNEYPPTEKVSNPPDLVTWATPTNLSGMQQLIDYLQYCRAYNNQGIYDCAYDRSSSQVNPTNQDTFAFAIYNDKIQACVDQGQKIIAKINAPYQVGLIYSDAAGAHGFNDPPAVVVSVKCGTLALVPDQPPHPPPHR